MAWLMRGVTTVFDAIFAPLGWVSPLVGLTVAALVTAVLALLVVKHTSNQVRVRKAKDGMYAALLEMRLFNDDLAAVLRAQWDVLRYNGRYLAAALVPMLWLLLPFGLVVAELDAFYADTGLAPNQAAVLTAHLRDGQTVAADQVHLVLPHGIGQDSPALWFPATRDVVWRLRPLESGTYTVTIDTPTETIAKSVVVSDAVARRSRARERPRGLAIIEPASEPPLADGSAFDAVSMTYPSRTVEVLGWHPPWFVIYGTLVIVFGFGLSRLLHVEI
jgi:hypothetical protein